jgi:hypothetical protein
MFFVDAMGEVFLEAELGAVEVLGRGGIRDMEKRDSNFEHTKSSREDAGEW